MQAGVLLQEAVQILRSQLTGSEHHARDAPGPSPSISHAPDAPGGPSPSIVIGTPPTHTTTHAINHTIPHRDSSGRYTSIIPTHFYTNSVHNNPETHSIHNTIPITLPNITASTSYNNTGPTCSNFQTLSQGSLSRLFEPTRNKRLQALASRRRTPTAVPWEHDFFCLAVPGQTTVPTPTETAELKNHGLGKKRVRFPDKEGTHLDLLKGLHEAYPPLKYAGGFKLYRSIRSKQLTEIPPQPDGYSIKYLKYESGLNRSVAYIVPLQEELRPDGSIPVIADELVIMYFFQLIEQGITYTTLTHID